MPADRDLLVSVERALDARFAVAPARASVSFLGVEPIEILRYNIEADVTVYVSLGMSRRAMIGSSEQLVPADGPRAELLVQVRGDAEDLWRQLAVLAAAPVVEGVVYSEGITVDLGMPFARRSRCTGALVAVPILPTVVSITAEVQILTLLPATSTELAWCRVHGADALHERWSSQGIDLLDLGRAAARLDP